MRVGITDTTDDPAALKRYLAWLQSGGEDVVCSPLSYEKDGVLAADECDGILLSGGGDVDPALYAGPKGHPTVHDVDPKRDSFERGILDRALKSGIPLLGICRGLQLANVHLGGTLVVDLPEAGYPGHRGAKGGECDHGVSVEANGTLRDSVRAAEGTVNSRHHQAADKPGEGLKVVARSGDGVVEAMELSNPEKSPFFLLVQWHPERMNGGPNPFSSDILTHFVAAVRTHNENKRKSR